MEPSKSEPLLVEKELCRDWITPVSCRVDETTACTVAVVAAQVLVGAAAHMLSRWCDELP